MQTQPLLCITLAACLIGCSPTAQQKAQQAAVAAQTDINALTPVATKAVDAILLGTGNAPAIPLNDTASAILQQAQPGLLNAIKNALAATPAATAPCPKP